ncbi:50S ribosomal protein L15 [bacterium]|nr:50S ribosomal protein L15 [bacterium]
MKINSLAPAQGARRKKKRIGRGLGSGWGKTSGKGSNGQKARSGGTKGIGFEGGQMPITQKMPKRGFTNIFRTEYEIVNLKDLAKFDAGVQVDPASLVAKGMIKKKVKVKILGVGEAPKQMTIKAHKFSKSASDKLTAAGGKAEVL